MSLRLGLSEFWTKCYLVKSILKKWKLSQNKSFVLDFCCTQQPYLNSFIFYDNNHCTKCFAKNIYISWFVQWPFAFFVKCPLFITHHNLINPLHRTTYSYICQLFAESTKKPLEKQQQQQILEAVIIKIKQRRINRIIWFKSQHFKMPLIYETSKISQIYNTLLLKIFLKFHKCYKLKYCT